jgi:hypothetical protein
VPLFQAGLENRKKPPRSSKKPSTNLGDTLFLHVPYHPANPASKAIQETFRDTLLYPRAATPLPQISNLHFGAKCGLRRLIIAYHRPPNLANLLCPRKMKKSPGPPVSAHVRRDREGHCDCALGLPPTAAIASHTHNTQNPGYPESQQDSTHSPHDSMSPVPRTTDFRQLSNLPNSPANPPIEHPVS